MPPRASRTLPFGNFFVRYFDWLRGGQEEEEEVLIDIVKVVAFSFSRANSLCHEVRSSRTSTGNLPAPGPDDLTLRREELRDFRKTLFLSHVSLKKFAEVWTRKKFQGGREK